MHAYALVALLAAASTGAIHLSGDRLGEVYQVMQEISDLRSVGIT